MSTPQNASAQPGAAQSPAASDEAQSGAHMDTRMDSSSALTDIWAEIRRETETFHAIQQQDIAALRAEMAARLAALRETLALMVPPDLMPPAATDPQMMSAALDTITDGADNTQQRADSAGAEAEPSTTRRTLLKWGGLAAAAGLAAAGGATLTTQTAQANDGDSMTLGSAGNQAGHVTTLTYDGTEASPKVFDVVASASDSIGISATVGSGTTSTNTGVNSAAGTDGHGVLGYASGNSAFGVWGASQSGYAVVGISGTGIDLVATGTGRLAQVPIGIVGAPQSGTYLAGEQIRDAYGNLFICVTGGTPGVWRKVVAQNAGYKNGTIKFLSTPIRVYDSRKTGGALVGNAIRNVQVSGVVIGGVQVPAGAIGCIGNLTVTSPSASGYVVIYPQGSPTPSTSTVNFLAHQTVANSFSVGLGNSGQATVHSFTSGQCHFIVDITGYIASL